MGQGKAGRKAQGCGNSCPWSARTHQRLQGDRDRVTRLRAGSALAGCGTGGMGCGSCLGLKRGEMGMETITGGRVWLQPVQP